jgi:NodT family efflux transporter outer membrane factor (OMF) lipoprotein
VRFLFPLVSLFVIVSCSHVPKVSPDSQLTISPADWSTVGAFSGNHKNDSYWPEQYANAELRAYIQQALNNNYELNQSRLNVDILQQRLTQAQANRLPELSLGLTNRRQQTSSQLSTSHALELDASVELDIWGKLSSQEQAQSYAYLSAIATVEQLTQQLVADVMTGFADAIEAQQLLALYKKLSENSAQNVDIIEDGYKQGLNSALDVYLARNELNSDLAAEAQQEGLAVAANRSFQRLLGEYPSGNLVLNSEIPSVTPSMHVDIPSTMVMQKPSVKALWLDLLAADAELAVAHKQRFPSFKLSASAGSSEEHLKDIFSSDLIWSLVSSVVAPLYNAGSLKASENIAALSLKQTELSYWDAVSTSFENVENGLSQDIFLQERIERSIAAKDNALAAQELSFEQYLKGLVSYTTVLDAQDRASAAQTTLIQLSTEAFTNRIELHLALGTNFGPNNTQSEVVNDNN